MRFKVLNLNRRVSEGRRCARMEPRPLCSLQVGALRNAAGRSGVRREARCVQVHESGTSHSTGVKNDFGFLFRELHVVSVDRKFVVRSRSPGGDRARAHRRLPTHATPPSTSRSMPPPTPPAGTSSRSAAPSQSGPSPCSLPSQESLDLGDDAALLSKGASGTRALANASRVQRLPR